MKIVIFLEKDEKKIVKEKVIGQLYIADYQYGEKFFHGVAMEIKRWAATTHYIDDRSTPKGDRKKPRMLKTIII